MGVPCKRQGEDGRSIRAKNSEVESQRHYIKKLQETIASIQSLLRHEDSNDKLRQEIEKLLAPQKHSKTSSLSLTRRFAVSIGASSGGSFSIFGPTSAFHTVVDMPVNSTAADSFDNFLMNLSSLMVCLENFFKYQYPDVVTFIHRESFLNDFLAPLSYSGYCSEVLIYSIAALGAKCSDDESLRELAPSFFDTARAKIFSEKICLPHVCTLQALLCLSLYQLGDGEASASWMLSGMAFRMGYDMGFQLNPKDWSIEHHTDASDPLPGLIAEMDIMVRSRVYWGCYVLDHFVSLVMGRPVTMRKSEATIPSSEHLPNSTGIDNFIFKPTAHTDSIANIDPSKSLLPLCSLSECIGSILSAIYSNEKQGEGLTYLSKPEIDDFNHTLSKWRLSLPADMKWSKASLKKHNYNPTHMNFRLYYYIMLLCLNRSFLTVNKNEGSSMELCDMAISELAICLSKFNDSSYPPSILVVYSAILGISMLLTKIHVLSTPQLHSDDVENLTVYYKTISSACLFWKLASKSMVYIKKKVAEINNQELTQTILAAEESYQRDYSQAEWNHIFRLDDDIALNLADNMFSNFFDLIHYDDPAKNALA